MCLTIKLGCKPEIAQTDIHCYKHVYSCGSTGWKGLFGYSDHMYPWNIPVNAEKYVQLPGVTKYVPINHLEVEAVHSGIEGRGLISYGFHANITKPLCKYRDCIIPAGTEFCYGNSGDIVSVNMIVFHRKYDYWKYILKKKLNIK
jgi:hypothetical protein